MLLKMARITVIGLVFLSTSMALPAETGGSSDASSEVALGVVEVHCRAIWGQRRGFPTA